MDHGQYSASRAHPNEKHGSFTPHIKLFGTVKMLKALLTGTEKKIDDHEFTQLVVVARIVEVNINSHRAKILISDGSGLAEVLQAIYNQHIDTADWQGRYFRFILHPNHTALDWEVNCQLMQPISNTNELTMHMATVVMGHVQRTRKHLDEEQPEN